MSAKLCTFGPLLTTTTTTQPPTPLAADKICKQSLPAFLTHSRNKGGFVDHYMGYAKALKKPTKLYQNTK